MTTTPQQTPQQTPETASAAELADFAASVRAALAAHSGPEQVRARLFAGARAHDELWSLLAGQLGLPGLMLPERHGGGGLGAVEMRVAFEEAGRALLGGPLLATAGLAVPLLLALGDDALERYAAPIAAGTLTATVALVEDDGGWDPDTVRTSAVPGNDGGCTVSGRKDLVVDGASADLLLVVARDPDGALAVVAIDRHAEGVRIEELVTLDHTRAMAGVELVDAPGVRLDPSGPGDTAAAVAAASDLSRVLLGAEQVGGAQYCLDATARYAGERIQFARPIGSFQAVKQRLADALVAVESARSAVYAASASAAARPAGAVPPVGGLARDARVAALLAGEAFTAIAADAIQLHGGVGFTWEHDVHLYYKRARTSAVLLGSASDHVAVLAAVLDHEID